MFPTHIRFSSLRKLRKLDLKTLAILFENSSASGQISLAITSVSFNDIKLGPS